MEPVRGVPVYYADDVLRVREPKVPLAPGALEIVLSDETVPDPGATFRKVYDTYMKIRSHWLANGVKGCYYLERRNASGVTRQIIPFYAGVLSSLVRQIRVTWNLLVPKLAWTKHEVIGGEQPLREALAPEFRHIEPSGVRGRDPFCQDARIHAQRIHEGTLANLLYNFKPLSTHDFLVTAKSHAPLFDTGTFVEAMTISHKLANKMAQVGYPIAYITMADDKTAGQTVPHAHIHASFAANPKEEKLGIFKIVRKILIDSWAELIAPPLFRLSDRQLAPIVLDRQRLLECALKT